MTSTTYWLQGIDDREWIFTFPFPLIPMESQAFLQFSFPSLSLIPIPLGFQLGYSLFHLPMHAQQNNIV